MARGKYEEDERQIPYHSDDYSDDPSEEDEDYDEEDLDTDFYEKDEDALYEDDTIIPVEWKLLKLGDARLRISNEGKIQFLEMSMFYVTSGHRDTGTPFRYIDVEVFKGDMRRYYVHDLVWRTFNLENPPVGWVVRHANHTPTDCNHCYENHLQYLDIYPDTVCTEYNIEKII